MDETQTVRFVWNRPARSVKLAGDFTNWQPIEMMYSDFIWWTEQRLDYGLHRFKFIVDHQWTHDSDLPVEYDAAGNINNTILVTPKSPLRPVRPLRQ